MSKKLEMIISATSLCFAMYTATAQPEKPNILIVCTDDQGIGQLKLKNGGFKASMIAQKAITKRYNCNSVKAVEAAEKAMPNIEKLQIKGSCFLTHLSLRQYVRHHAARY